jgi:hypothetical protein
MHWEIKYRKIIGIYRNKIVDLSDASLIVVAMNCTGLQLLCTHGCDGLSSDELRCNEFKSVSELRAVLLSITDIPASEQHDDDVPHLVNTHCLT